MKVWVLGLSDQPLGVYYSRAALLAAWASYEGRYAPLSANYWAEQAYLADAREAIS